MTIYEGFLGSGSGLSRRTLAAAAGVLIATGGIMASCDDPPIIWKRTAGEGSPVNAPVATNHAALGEATAALQAAHNQTLARVALAGVEG